MTRSRRAARPAAGAILLALLALLVPRLAASHGPSVRVSYARIQPPLLSVRVGETVHFHNANTGAGSCTVVADNGAFRSPPLGRAEGWHRVFDEVGSYPFFVEEYPKARGQIVVSEQ